MVTEAGRELAAAPAGARPATSVFFGGGTPSLVPAAGLVRVLDAIPRRPDAEVTVECNPDTVTAELLDDLPGRRGEPAVVRGAVDGGPRAGRPGPHPRRGQRGAGRRPGPRGRLRVAQPRPDLRRGGRVARRLAHAPSSGWWPSTSPHVSAYALTVEAGTPLAADPARHPDDDDQADKYLMAVERAGRGRPRVLRDLELGPARASPAATTSSTGARATTSGLGCAAHSHRAGRRWWNVRTPDRYLELIVVGPVGRGRVRGARRRRPSHRGAAAGAAHHATACRSGALPDDDPALEGLVETAGEPPAPDGGRSAAGQRGGAAAQLGAQAAGTAGRANTWPGNTRSGSSADHQDVVVGPDQRVEVARRSRASRGRRPHAACSVRSATRHR